MFWRDDFVSERKQCKFITERLMKLKSFTNRNALAMISGLNAADLLLLEILDNTPGKYKD